MSISLKKHRSHPSLMPLQTTDACEISQNGSLLSYLQPSQNFDFRKVSRQKDEFTLMFSQIKNVNDTKNTSRLSDIQRVPSNNGHCESKIFRSQYEEQIRRLREYYPEGKQKIIEANKRQELLADMIEHRNKGTFQYENRLSRDVYLTKPNSAIKATLCYNCYSRSPPMNDIRSQISPTPVKKSNHQFLRIDRKWQQAENSTMSQFGKQSSFLKNLQISKQNKFSNKDKFIPNFSLRNQKTIKDNNENVRKERARKQLKIENWDGQEDQGASCDRLNMTEQVISRFYTGNNSLNPSTNNSGIVPISIKKDKKLKLTQNANLFLQKEQEQTSYQNRQSLKQDKTSILIQEYEKQNELIEKQNYELQNKILQKINNQSKLISKLNRIMKKIQSMKQLQIKLKKQKTIFQQQSSPYHPESNRFNQKSNRNQPITSRFGYQQPTESQRSTKASFHLQNPNKNNNIDDVLVHCYQHHQQVSQKHQTTKNRKIIPYIPTETILEHSIIDQLGYKPSSEDFTYSRFLKNQDEKQFSAFNPCLNNTSKRKSGVNCNELSISGFESRLVPRQTNEQKLRQMEDMFQEELKRCFAQNQKNESQPCFNKNKNRNLLHQQSLDVNLSNQNTIKHQKDRQEDCRNMREINVRRGESKQKLKKMSQQIKLLRQTIEKEHLKSNQFLISNQHLN